MQILKELKEKGINLKVIDKNKLWVGPKSKITNEIREKVRQHKAELIEAIQSKSQPTSIEHMTLDEFEKANKALKIQSSVLNEIIYFASNDEIAKRLRKEGFVIYTADELKVLAKRKPQPEELKLLHEIKNVFPSSKVIQ